MNASIRRPVPVALRELAHRWTRDGRPPQPGSHWSLNSWSALFPQDQPFLATLPNPIDREAATRLCRQADASPAEARRSFLAAMIWGYGSVGYGAYRTAKVLSENEAATERLHHVARLAMTDGGPIAFAWLARNRLHGLGVAFATKYLFFCAASDGKVPPAAVLDRLVRGWLREKADWTLRLDWCVPDYRVYVETLVEWGEKLQLSPAHVEYLMFQDARTAEPTNQWSGRALSDAHPNIDPLRVHDVSYDQTAALAALDDAAEAFSAVAGASAEHIDDFEHSVRHLKWIVLSTVHTQRG